MISLACDIRIANIAIDLTEIHVRNMRADMLRLSEMSEKIKQKKIIGVRLRYLHLISPRIMQGLSLQNIDTHPSQTDVWSRYATAQTEFKQEFDTTFG